jgi:hypothetical protein
LRLSRLSARFLTGKAVLVELVDELGRELPLLKVGEGLLYLGAGGSWPGILPQRVAWE